MFKKLNATFFSREQLKNIYGGDIRKYRDENCLTQDYMANQLGISQSAYHKIESGTVKISMERLVPIADILNKPLEVFIGGNESRSETAKTNENIQLSETEYALMKKIILQQEKRIEELEAKIGRKDTKIEELKNQMM